MPLSALVFVNCSKYPYLYLYLDLNWKLLWPKLKGLNNQ